MSACVLIWLLYKRHKQCFLFPTVSLSLEKRVLILNIAEFKWFNRFHRNTYFAQKNKVCMCKSIEMIFWPHELCSCSVVIWYSAGFDDKIDHCVSWLNWGVNLRFLILLEGLRGIYCIKVKGCLEICHIFLITQPKATSTLLTNVCIFLKRPQTSILFDKELVNEFILYTFYFLFFCKLSGRLTYQMKLTVISLLQFLLWSECMRECFDWAYSQDTVTHIAVYEYNVKIAVY